MKLKIIERFDQDDRDWKYEDIIDDFGSNKVENPIGVTIPDGEYMIRGDEKDHRKHYYVLDNVWYLHSDVVTDNGHSFCESETFKLYPSLPEKEWDKLKKVGWKRLNKVWQRHLLGYLHGQELRKIRRDIRLNFLRWDKIILNEN